MRNITCDRTRVAPGLSPLNTVDGMPQCHSRVNIAVHCVRVRIVVDGAVRQGGAPSWPVTRSESGGQRDESEGGEAHGRHQAGGARGGAGPPGYSRLFAGIVCAGLAFLAARTLGLVRVCCSCARRPANARACVRRGAYARFCRGYFNARAGTRRIYTRGAAGGRGGLQGGRR